MIRNRSTPFVDELNNFLPGQIEFTTEIEVNGTIPYLGMLLIRQPDGTVKIDWYQKPTACNRTLHFHSQHPLKQKIAVAYGMFHRELSLVDLEFTEKTITRIVNILRENSYSLNLIIMKQLRKFDAAQQARQNGPNCSSSSSFGGSVSSNGVSSSSSTFSSTFVSNVFCKLQHENKIVLLECGISMAGGSSSGTATVVISRPARDITTGCPPYVGSSGVLHSVGSFGVCFARIFCSNSYSRFLYDCPLAFDFLKMYFTNSYFFKRSLLPV